MATAVMVAKEATHGTVGTTFTSIPCAFKPVNKQANKVWDEDRNGQDRNFAMSTGPAHEEWSVGDSAVYHDTIGFWLCSAMGLPTTVLHASETLVHDNAFTFLDDPVSLSLRWQQPRRYTQAYESLYNVVDKMEFKFAADGELTYTCSGVGMPETTHAQLTHAFSTAKPIPVWTGAVKIGGTAYAQLVSGQVTFTRNRKPFHTINNTKAPQSMSIGGRMVEFQLVCDFVTTADYDDFVNGTDRSLQITFADTDVTIGTSANPTLDIKLGTTAYETGEIDTDPDLPQVKLTGKALFNNTDASLSVVTVTSTVDYTA